MGEKEGTRGGPCLKVQMLGGFSLTWDGRPVAGSRKSSESQFNYLMQLLLHHREEGVSRDMLEQVLFEDRDILDVHHAARSVIYNAKRRLRAAGLPDVPYIEQRRGVCLWTGQVPVEEDAARFEALCAAAQAAQGPREELALRLEACRAYTGEFLPQQAAVPWAAQEARRYRGMFCACVERAVELLRAAQDFRQMEALGRYASSISPLSDWEAVTMEALAAMGRHEDARRLYSDTVDLYFREQGLRPSRRMSELFDRLGAQMGSRYDALDDIQRELSEGQGEGMGGYLCAYPVFQGIYRMVGRMMERGGQSVYLMLCMVVDGKGNPMREGPMLEELAGRLEEAIRASVRHGDAISRYGKGQYLVLLMNTTRENCGVVQRRIDSRFLIGRQRTGIRYYVNSVACLPDGGSAGEGGG